MSMSTRQAESRFAVALAALLVWVNACAPTTTQLATAGESRPPPPREMSLGQDQQSLVDAALGLCGDWPEVDGAVALTAEVTLDGVSSGGRIRSRLWLALDLIAGAMRIEPVQPWPPAFVYIGTGLYERPGDEPDVDSTLILPQRNDAIRGVSSSNLFSPLLGVPLSAPELITVITGCRSYRGSLNGYTIAPGKVRLIFEDALPAEMWAVRDESQKSGWALVATGRAIPGSTLQWRAEYGRRVLAAFRDFRIRSQDWNGVVNRAFDVSFSWGNVKAGVVLDRRLFSTEPPLPRPQS